MTEPRPMAGGDLRTFLLCFLAALAEGYDLQCTGVAAPRFVPELMLSTGQAGWVFTSSTIGLLIGAAVGGWAADRIGRKWVLTYSMALFGLFTVGTALSDSYGVLVAMRLFTGLGLGGALPILIALVAETGSPGARAAKVTMLSAGMPMGGVGASLLVLLGPPDLDWRIIFHVGGWAPIALAALMAAALPESRTFLAHSAARLSNGAARRSTAFALFDEGRAARTLLLWVCFFFTLLALYMLLNWLPTLLVAKGFTKPQAALINMVFSLGGAAGALALGWLAGRGGRRILYAVTYVAMAAGLFVLAGAPADMSAALPAAFVTGVFVVGAQFLLYGLSPTLYPGPVRGTGVGWAVSVGRGGSVAGPALAGIILAGGGGGGQAIMAILPGIAIALAAVLALTWRPAPQVD